MCDSFCYIYQDQDQIYSVKYKERPNVSEQKNTTLLFNTFCREVWKDV